VRPLSWLIAAAAVHVLIALLVFFLGSRKTMHAVPRRDEAPPAEIDIAIVESAPTEEGKIAVVTAAPRAATATNRAASASSTTSPFIADMGFIEDRGESSAEPAAPAAEATSPQLSLGALGLGGAGSNPFFRPGALPEEKPKPDDNTAGRTLREGLRERDLALGLGPEGPVLEALREATSLSAAPERGYAIFAVKLDANGLVTDIQIGDRAGGTGWDEAKAGALKSLRGKKLALRGGMAGARGAELKIEIKSDVVLPSGNRVGERIKTPLTKSHVSRAENVPGGTPDVVQTVTVATFDVTDIGAKPRRVVHAHLLSATPL